MMGGATPKTAGRLPLARVAAGRALSAGRCAVSRRGVAAALPRWFFVSGLARCATQRQRLSRKGGSSALALRNESGKRKLKRSGASSGQRRSPQALLCCPKMADDAAPEPEPEAESGTPARLPEPDKAGYEAKVQSIKDDIDAKQGRMVSAAVTLYSCMWSQARRYLLCCCAECRLPIYR